MQKTTAIYLPGLGDRFDGLRQFALRGWRSRSLDVIFVPMNWDDTDDSLEDKLARVKQAIDTSQGRAVLVGESAGAPVALVAQSKFSGRVDLVATICGMNQHASQVRPSIYARHPAFRDTMLQADEVVNGLSDRDKKHINIFYSRNDQTVSPEHTLIAGVRSGSIWMPVHMLAIALYLTVLKRRVITAIK